MVRSPFGPAWKLACILICLTAVCSIGCRRAAESPASTAGGAPARMEAAGSLPVRFDPARDPAQDLRLAVDRATSSGKRVILDVGGEWCSWCHTLDRFIEEHAEVKARIERDFVWLKVNWSEEQQNLPFLSKYPKISGYPHLFVLERDGTLLHSQDTALLEEGASYNLGRVMEFLGRWAPTGGGRAGA